MNRKPLSEIHISIRSYEHTYGHKPRGRGYWGFYLGDDATDPLRLFWHSGTYAEAKRAALKAAQAMDVPYIVVAT